MPAFRLTLGGKFLLAIVPFILTSSIGTAVYYDALHKGERAFEQALSEESRLDDAAHDAASNAIRVAIGTLSYLREPTANQRVRVERARADYWEAKTRYDQLRQKSLPREEQARLAAAFERFALLSQSLIEHQDLSAPARARVERAEDDWRATLKKLNPGRGPSRQQIAESRARLAELDKARAAYEAQSAPMAKDLEEFLQLRDELDDRLDEGHRSAMMLTASKRLAVSAAQQGIELVWIVAVLQCTLGVGAILFLSRRLRARIGHIAEATRAVSAGNLSARVPESGFDELTGLARQFNRMANQLELTTVSRSELEDREAALRLSEERLRLLVERLKDCAIFTVGSLGSITSWNAGAERLYGYREQEVVGAPLQTLYAEPSEERSAQRHLELALQAGGYAFDEEQRRRDGSQFWAEVSVTPLDPRTRLADFVVLVRDVTVQHASGLERQRHLDQLAHTGRLSVMGEMAAGFAHELNQPLGAISNYAEGCLLRLTRDGVPPEILRQILERISSEAQRAGDIIHRVRAFARKDESHHEEVDVAAAIEHVAALLNHDAVQQGVDLHIDLAPKLPTVSGDRVQIEQVLVNLIRNAFDAVRSSQSEYSTRVAVRATVNEEGDLLLEVEDTGCGVPEGSEPKLFDAFYTTKADGLGMGLAISRTIVESHGGRIWATRNSDRGLTAHVTIPARRPGDEGLQARRFATAPEPG